jgi:hypothetical protein
MTEELFLKLKSHLFPGDDLEAAAIAICGRGIVSDSIQLLVHELILIPYEDCSIRRSDLVRWPTDRLIPLLQRAEKNNLSILKIHCHPTGYDKFSETDDKSDLELFSSIYGWVNDSGPHASAVMLPDGSMFARIILEDLSFKPVDKITSVGDDILFLNKKTENQSISPYSIRTSQAFGEKTTLLLNQLKIGIVGCSGTGSLVIEQLHRLKVGELLLIDPDKIEDVNLNRIPYSTARDAKLGKYKVDLFKEVIESCELGCKIEVVPKNIYDDNEIISLLSSCDVIFGCMDSIDGRHFMNRVATFYLLPYFDIGVKLISDRKGGIEKILAAVHYIQPGKSSLMSRNVYTSEELRSATLKRTNPEFFSEQLKSKYITDVHVQSPAVISVNMQAASLAINDFLARIHPYRYSRNKLYASTVFDITDWSISHEQEAEFDKLLKKYVGRGNMPHPLDITQIQTI